MEKSRRKINNIRFWKCYRVLPPRDLASPLIKGSVWEVTKEPGPLFWSFRSDFHSLDLELIHLFRSNKA